MSWPFASGCQSIGTSASATVLPMNNQGWFPLGLIGLISLPSKGLTRVFSSTTVWEHHFRWPHSILQIHYPWFDCSLTVRHLRHVSCVTIINNEYPCTEIFVHLIHLSNRHLLSFCKCIPLRVQEDKSSPLWCVWSVWKSLSHVRLFATPWTLWDAMVHMYSPWNSPGQNPGVGSLSLLQGIFPTQGSNPSLLHCRRILYQLSHEGSLEYTQ